MQWAADLRRSVPLGEWLGQGRANVRVLSPLLHRTSSCRWWWPSLALGRASLIRPAHMVSQMRIYSICSRRSPVILTYSPSIRQTKPTFTPQHHSTSQDAIHIFPHETYSTSPWALSLSRTKCLFKAISPNQCLPNTTTPISTILLTQSVLWLCTQSKFGIHKVHIKTKTNIT